MGTLKTGRPSGRTAEHVAGAVKKLDGEARLTLRVSKSEMRGYKQFALDHDTTLSDLVRTALSEYMNTVNSNTCKR